MTTQSTKLSALLVEQLQLLNQISRCHDAGNVGEVAELVDRLLAVQAKIRRVRRRS